MKDDYPGVKFNATFRGDHSSDLNACVGNNGFPSYYEYANGFADAAILLIESAIKSLRVDEQVYPICFTMRHSVELRLKHQIERLGLIRPEISLQDFDANKSHDIGIIWKYFKEKAPIFDRRFASLIDEVDAYISDIAEVDPTGQTFRYPLSNESVKHLTEVSLINVLHLKERFTLLRAKLENLHYFTDGLIEEYYWSSYTKNLSRSDISDICRKLPPYNSWTSELEAAKNEIKNDYNISSKEFGDCLNLIKKHYEFAHRIGLVIPPKVASLEDLSIFFERSIRIHSTLSHEKAPKGVFITKAPSVKEIKQYNSAIKLAANECVEDIPPASFIDIAALFEYGRHGDYSEFYDYAFKLESRSLPQLIKNKEEYFGAIYHLLSKVNSHTTILRALDSLNQTKITAELRDRFDLL